MRILFSDNYLSTFFNSPFFNPANTLPALDRVCTPHFSLTSFLYFSRKDVCANDERTTTNDERMSPNAEREKHLSRLAPTSVTFSNIQFICNKTSSHTRAAALLALRIWDFENLSAKGGREFS